MKLLEKYVYSTCLHPVKVHIYNHVTKKTEDREVPCGKCLHCRMTRVSEWVTRMICESLMYKHVYYVTLTYDSKVLEQRPDIAADTHAVVHSYNKFHRPQLAPLTLCKRHTQLFWKRLRKNNPDITFAYYLCGEYGHKYGRPHYHAVIWSDDIITRDMILDAWQHLCTPDALAYEDLKASNSSPKVYSYVCKYLFKDFKFTDLPTYRLHVDRFNLMYASELDFYKTHHEAQIYVNEIHNDYESYEKDQHIFDYATSLVDLEKQEAAFAQTHTFADWYAKIYNPFTTCSRKRSIGSRYVQKYLQEYSKGNLRIFGIHDKHLVFPQFFTRKAKKSVCPFAPLSPKSGKPTSVASITHILSYVGDLQVHMLDVYDAISMDCETGRYDTIVSKVCGRLTRHKFNRLDFYDYESHTYFMYYEDAGTHGYSLCRYDRSKRCYEVFDWLSVRDVVVYLQVFYDALYDTFLRPFEVSHQQKVKEKKDFISKCFQSEAEFNLYLEQTYEIIQKNRAIKQAQYKLTKQLF